MERLEAFLLERMEENQVRGKLRRYQEYMDGLLEWNKKVNLTSITNPQEFITKHYLDSLTVADSYELEDAETIIDIGTGGGFPGVPLAIFFPDKQFVLVDSLEKRLKIIDALCQDCQIKNVRTVHGRAEELAHKKEFREKFDVCVSRAVGNLSTLSEYCLPFVAVGGTFIAFKGPDGEEEATEAEGAIMKLGGALSGIEEAEIDTLPEEEALHHTLVYIEKEERTAKQYPRKAGKPSKEPLK